MPSKKKKYNARFPAGRIKKIMQSDEEIGKVAQAVPVIISRTLELFVESLLTKTLRITNSRNAKTLSPSHMKQCIMSEQRFDFLKELVKNIPDISVAEEAASCIYNDDDVQSSEEQYPDSDTPYDLSLPSTSLRGLPNGSNTLLRSASYNGAGVKRHHIHNPPSTPSTPSVIMPTALALNQLHQQPSVGHHHLPAKLARSESTPAYTQRGRPPNNHSSSSSSNNNNNNNNNNSTYFNNRQIHETAIPAPICSLDMLKKPIVKIDYSNVTTTATSLMDADNTGSSSSSSTANAAFNFDIAAPVINIDLSNIVAAGTASVTASSTASAATSPTTNISFLGGCGVSNNSISKMTATVSNMSGKSKTPIIPKATLAPVVMAPITESLLELDEDYDNI